MSFGSTLQVFLGYAEFQRHLNVTGSPQAFPSALLVLRPLGLGSLCKCLHFRA